VPGSLVLSETKDLAMSEGKTIDLTILAQFTGSETFYRFGFRGDVLITERVGLTQ